jgi:hypothetical protein
MLFFLEAEAPKQELLVLKQLLIVIGVLGLNLAFYKILIKIYLRIFSYIYNFTRKQPTA